MTKQQPRKHGIHSYLRWVAGGGSVNTKDVDDLPTNPDWTAAETTAWRKKVKLAGEIVATLKSQGSLSAARREAAHMSDELAGAVGDDWSTPPQPDPAELAALVTRRY